MIFDSVHNWRLYPLGQMWEQAFLFLEGVGPDLPLGRYPIAGIHPDDTADVFAVVEEYTPVPAGTKTFETHQRYVDIQYLLRGEEWLDYAPLTPELAVDTPYDAARDAAFHAVPEKVSARVLLGGGMFCALFPDDAHCPGLSACPPENMGEELPVVRKLVVKIRVSLLERHNEPPVGAV